MTAGEIGARVDRPAATIAKWARAGLLGPPKTTGRVRKWDRTGLENARLGDYLLPRGTKWEELLSEARANRLPQLGLTRALGGQGGITRHQLAKRGGLSPRIAPPTWR